ncbi:MAG: cytochrome c biogenesis protein [Cytophagales bacterium]|nr:cytochrome c biogenesis protein [Cytophagales bacterium]
MEKLKNNWWKWATGLLLFYVVVGGLLLDVPRLPILNETIRGLYFHVPMWFGMMLLLFISFIFSIRYIHQGDLAFDDKAAAFASVGIVFGLLGMLTGMIWAQFTWGIPWSNDPKQNASAIVLFIYLAYGVVRNSFEDEQRRARISAVYNTLAFAILIPLLIILPRFTDSLHPGSGGNPGFNAYDLDHRLRWVFYPAVVGWFLLGMWIAKLIANFRFLKRASEEI